MQLWLHYLFPPALREVHAPVTAIFLVSVFEAIPDQDAVAFSAVSPSTANSATTLAMLQNPWNYFQNYTTDRIFEP